MNSPVSRGIKHVVILGPAKDLHRRGSLSTGTLGSFDAQLGTYHL